MSKPPTDDIDKEKGYQETVALPREAFLIKPDERPSDYQETVAISRADLDIKLDDRPTDYQATVAISRTILELQPEDKPEDYQATVAISRAGLELQSEDKPEGYQATVAIPRGGLEFMSDDTSQEDKPNDYQATVAISREGIEELKSVSGSDASFAATALERAYYQKTVRGSNRDKYRFEEKLGSGGMGAVLKVLDQDLQRISAMKVVLPRWKNDQDTLTSFITEAKITGLLEHPNIIPVHELGLLSESGIFFTMKIAGGEPLIDILNNIKQNKPEHVEKYSTYQLLSIFRKACDAISFAHSKDIIHQDIKPHNIMVGQYGEVLLMDWGMAKYIGDPEKEIDLVHREIMNNILIFSKSKQQDMIKGSPAYMSPEQVIGDPLDKQSDIFLLGSTLYHIFTLEPPYTGENMNEVLKKAKAGDLIPPQTRNPARQIPEEICRIILKAMAYNKKDRYQKVEELSGDIDDVIAGKWLQQEKKVFAAGETLMKEGEAGEEAYLLLKGKLQVIKTTGGRKIALGTLKEGGIVGEMALITKEARSASVEALEETEVAVLTKAIVSHNLKKLPPYMEKIVSTLTDRLRIANANIHPHLTSDCTYVVLKQFRLIFKDKSDNKIDKYALPFEETIEEISEDLGIPTQKVKEVLEKAVKSNLIACENNKVRIPNIEEFVRFTNSLKS